MHPPSPHGGRFTRQQFFTKSSGGAPLSFPRGGGKLSARNELTDEGVTKLVDLNIVLTEKPQPPNPSFVRTCGSATFPPQGKVSEATVFRQVLGCLALGLTLKRMEGITRGADEPRKSIYAKDKTDNAKENYRYCIDKQYYTLYNIIQIRSKEVGRCSV